MNFTIFRHYLKHVFDPQMKLTDTSTPGWSGPGTNGNKRLTPHFPDPCHLSFTILKTLFWVRGSYPSVKGGSWHKPYQPGERKRERERKSDLRIWCNCKTSWRGINPEKSSKFIWETPEKKKKRKSILINIQTFYLHSILSFLPNTAKTNRWADYWKLSFLANQYLLPVLINNSKVFSWKLLKERYKFKCMLGKKIWNIVNHYI